MDQANGNTARARRADRYPRTSWRAIVLTRADVLGSELQALVASAPVPGTGSSPESERSAESAIRQQIEHLLRKARSAAQDHSILQWWTGSNIERAWRSVHEADVLLAPLQRAETIRARYPAVLASARQLLRS